MKVFLLLGLGIILMGILFFVALAVLSQQEPEGLGLHNGKLAACSSAPNCVCSETHSKDDKTHFIAPFSAKHGAWKALQHTLEQQGGQIERMQSHYLHATFRSKIFHFVDDVECRWDEDEQRIHIRSASRVGHSDLGVNRQRLEHIRSLLPTVP